MNRVAKAFAVLAVALAVLGVVLWMRAARQEAALGPAYVFDTAREAAVVRLDVAYRSDSVSLVRDGSGWVVLPDGVPADEARVREAIGKLLRVEARERVSISGDPVRLKEFGLNGDEAKRVAWTFADGTSGRILVGNVSGTDFASTYWKHAERPGVYRTPGSLTHAIPARAIDWKAAPAADTAVQAPGDPALRAAEMEFVDVHEGHP